MGKGTKGFKALVDVRGTFYFLLFLVESLIRLDRYKTFKPLRENSKIPGIARKSK